MVTHNLCNVKMKTAWLFPEVFQEELVQRDLGLVVELLVHGLGLLKIVMKKTNVVPKEVEPIKPTALI